MTDVPLARLDYAPFLYFGRIHHQNRTATLSGPSMEACYHLLSVQDGTLFLERKGHRWELRAGTAAIVEPGASVSWRSECHFRRLTFDLVHRRRRTGGRQQGTVVLDDQTPQPDWLDLFGMPLPERIDEAILPSLQVSIAKLSGEGSGSVQSVITGSSVLSLLIATYVRHLTMRSQPRETSGTQDPSLRLIHLFERYLLIHASQRNAIGRAAEELGYSPEYLSRMYRQHRGMTPRSHLRELRLERACRLLVEKPGLAFSQVARQVGWTSVDSMRKAFLDAYGETPRAWRLRQLSG